MSKIHYAETRYGFQYGAADVSRLTSDDRKGWVVLQIKTPKTTLQVYVTKTGKLRSTEFPTVKFNAAEFAMNILPEKESCRQVK